MQEKDGPHTGPNRRAMFNIKRQCHEVLIIPAYFQPVRVLCPKKTGFFEELCPEHKEDKLWEGTDCKGRNANICVGSGCYGKICKEN
jgi:hypothetical protein